MSEQQQEMVRQLNARPKSLSDWERNFLERVGSEQLPGVSRNLTEWQSSQLKVVYRAVYGMKKQIAA